MFYTYLNNNNTKDVGWFNEGDHSIRGGESIDLLRGKLLTGCPCTTGWIKPQHLCGQSFLHRDPIERLCVFGRRLYSADGRRDRQTQTADADADVRIADSDFEISKVLKFFWSCFINYTHREDWLCISRPWKLLPHWIPYHPRRPCLPSKHDTLKQCWFNDGPSSSTMAPQ